MSKSKQIPTPKAPPMREHDDDGDEAERSRRTSSSAGDKYAGDHRNHGEPDTDVDDDDVIEEADLDEMPSFEGPDA
jgi:hypothetical protein